MTGSDDRHCVVYKRCGCSDEVSGRRLGGRCGRLAEVGHGSWYFAVQVVGAPGRRERVRRGGFASAEAARCAGGELLLAEEEGPLSAGCTVGQWLRYWLSVVESRLRPTTHRAYRDHVRLHLVPYLGRIRLAELLRWDVTRTFVALGRRRNRYGQPISASTLERIRATLRAALNHAVREDLIIANPAQELRLPAPVRIHPVVWTARREAAWRHGGERPPVAVWTVEQLAAFLRLAHEDPLFVLWWLVALRGLRRGEVAGLRWLDVDLGRRELTVAHQPVHTDDGLVLCEPAQGFGRFPGGQLPLRVVDDAGDALHVHRDQHLDGHLVPLAETGSTAPNTERGALRTRGGSVQKVLLTLTCVLALGLSAAPAHAQDPAPPSESMAGGDACTAFGCYTGDGWGSGFSRWVADGDKMWVCDRAADGYSIVTKAWIGGDSQSDKWHTGGGGGCTERSYGDVAEGRAIAFYTCLGDYSENKILGDSCGPWQYSTT
ncbi:site-specific integrase [Nonomuraea basaltis]|uniref:site-specific integrase n=1 Tax=Nonomuraea basaltis TaxID=2495887 RepID=UPI00110C6550|nr:hypothetical protein [Nonomuraea basaltis]TMR93967.1 hypothetical protein EJK15_36285 [Nonomuraea basaltis]